MSFAALFAGMKPKNTPMNTETPKLSAMADTEGEALMPMIFPAMTATKRLRQTAD